MGARIRIEHVMVALVVHLDDVQLSLSCCNRKRCLFQSVAYVELCRELLLEELEKLYLAVLSADVEYCVTISAHNGIGINV